MFDRRKQILNRPKVLWKEYVLWTAVNFIKKKTSKLYNVQAEMQISH